MAEWSMSAKCAESQLDANGETPPMWLPAPPGWFLVETVLAPGSEVHSFSHPVAYFEQYLTKFGDWVGIPVYIGGADLVRTQSVCPGSRVPIGDNFEISDGWIRHFLLATTDTVASVIADSQSRVTYAASQSRQG